MKKVRWVFIFIMIVVLGAGAYKLHQRTGSVKKTELKTTPLMITAVSRKGGLFRDRKLTMKIDSSFPLDFRNEVILAGDSMTAFEFVCGDIFFRCMPGTVVSYRNGIEELHFIKGSASWRRSSEGSEKPEVYVGQLRDRIVPGLKGSMIFGRGLREYRSLKGDLKIEIRNRLSVLKEGELLILNNKKLPEKLKLLDGPSQIAPLNLVRNLEKPEDSIVQFNWKSVKGAKEYILRLYLSELLEHVVFEKKLKLNRLGVNLVSVKENGDYYWRIFPVDYQGVEGNGSEIGRIHLKGMLLDRSRTFVKPELSVTSLTVSGDVVMIKGAADKNSQLFIDEKEVIIGSDGSFFHTLKYTTIGAKNIMFRLVSPAGMETVFERKVVIFEE